MPEIGNLPINDSIITKLERTYPMTDQLNEAPVNAKSVEAICNFLQFLVSVSDTFHNVTAVNSASGSKITLPELVQFIPSAMKIPAAIGSLNEIPVELSDQITAEELAQISAVVTSSAYLAENANVAEVVEDGLALANQIKDFIQKYFIKK